MLQTQSGFINIEFLDDTQQKNESDCGVYAIANAVEICKGYDPAVCLQLGWWDGIAMQKHLLHCLDKEDLVPFPQGALCHPGGVLHKTCEVAVLYCHSRKSYK